MLDVLIREAGSRDAPVIIRFLRAMLEEMASMGGHAVSQKAITWARLENTIHEQREGESHLYLLAELGNKAPTPIGFAEASVVGLHPLLEPKRVLHVHALYVLELYRRRGVGQALLKVVLDWGRCSGCIEAELNALVANPAQALYEKLGFAVSELEMRRKL
jgi:GNAT superfamily N-acetyltransferase